MSIPLCRTECARCVGFVSLAIPVLLVASGACSTEQDPFSSPEARDHAAAMGAHHLCSGVFVVGRDYQRTAEQVFAEDIEPFPHFNWQDDFEYEVDMEAQTAGVWGPDIARRTAKNNGDQGCSILGRRLHGADDHGDSVT